MTTMQKIHSIEEAEDFYRPHIYLNVFKCDLPRRELFKILNSLVLHNISQYVKLDIANMSIKAIPCEKKENQYCYLFVISGEKHTYMFSLEKHQLIFIDGFEIKIIEDKALRQSLLRWCSARIDEVEHHLD